MGASGFSGFSGGTNFNVEDLEIYLKILEIYLDLVAEEKVKAIKLI